MSIPMMVRESMELLFIAAIFVVQIGKQLYSETMFTLMEVLKPMAPWFTTAIVVVQIGKQLYSQTMFTLMEVLKSLAPLFAAAILVLQSPIVKDYFSPRLTMIIEGSDDLGQNQIYKAATTYIRNKISVSPKPRHFKCRKAIKGEKLVFDFVGEDTIIDNFEGIKLEWKSRDKINEHNGKTVSKYFELSFNKRFENKVLVSYLPSIVDLYERDDDRVVKLYTRDNGYGGSAGVDRDGDWIYVILKHPFTFEKLAMDPKQKEMLINDLSRFTRRKDLYENVGKAWKRGYLLYGPPGTGKSSLIAAMATYLRFNIYDLKLSVRYTDEDLRSILLSTTNRSILVIEDIDCGADLDYQRRRYDSFTLSGLLNMIDGLWSSCGDERIIVFTTNDKDKLDPALLRPGRIDVHVHMSYCTIDGFKLLAKNYLQIEGDPKLYMQIEDLLENVEVTPAEIAEELLKSDGTDDVLQGVVEFLEQRKLEKANAAELKKRLKERLNSADIDVDAEGLVKFLKQKKLENAKATEAERLLNSGDTDVDVEGLVKFIKQKKIEDAKAAEAKRINPNES